MSSVMSTIEEERKKKENQICADCFSPDPLFVSLDIGVFICASCSKIHKQLKQGLNSVTTHLTQKFTADQINFISTKGNKVVNELYEKHLPKYYHRPNDEDHLLIREQFIKAKYERLEFQDLKNQHAYGGGSKEGILFKRGKGNDKFLQRRFVLKEPEGILKYYVKPADKSPKDTIIIRNLVNVYIVPHKVKNNNGMQITHEKEGTRRNLFVFGIDGKTTSDWYHALRASMVRHKYQNFPDDQMRKYLNTRIIQEGWMSKTGPKRLEKFRRRWFTLVGNMIWYYTQPLDPHPLGYIPLGSRTFGYGVMKGLPQGIKSEGFSLTVHTPDRIYALVCFTLESRDKWVDCIEEALDGCTTVWSQPSMGKSKPSKPDTTSQDSDACSSQDRDESSSGSNTPEFVQRIRRVNEYNTFQKTSKTMTSKHLKKQTSLKYPRKVQSLMYRDALSNKCNKSDKPRGILKKCISVDSHLYSDESDGTFYDSETDSDDIIDDITIGEITDLPKLSTSTPEQEDDNSELKSLEKRSEDLSQQTGENGLIQSTIGESLTPSPDPGSQSPNSAAKKPQKPPRKRLIKQGTASSLELSDQDSVRLSCESSPMVETPPNPSFDDVKDDQESQPDATPHNLTVAGLSFSSDEDFSDFESARPSSIYRSIEDENSEWRKKTFSSSIRRITGNERISTKRLVTKRAPSVSSVASSAIFGDNKEIKPRPVDVTLFNQLKDGFWFMIFQAEMKPDSVESYVTPWVGAQVAEMPASVGPMKVPSEFQIAVIDTAPGGFGIQRTTGPFPAEPGDVWEVEVPNDDGSTPEMFYHEGMVTDDGSVTIYSNITNLKKFEVAIFKSGRKLFSRKNVKSGDVVVIRIKPALFFLAVDQDTYFDMEDQDFRVSEFLNHTQCVELNYRQSKLKVQSKKRGSTVYFTKM